MPDLTRARHHVIMLAMSEMQQSPARNVPAWTRGWRIARALAEVNHMTDQEVANYLGVHRGTISRWTHDKAPVKDAFMRQISLLSGVDYDWIAFGHSNRPPPGQSTDQPAGAKVSRHLELLAA